jgi:hypothetical protein
MRRYRILAAEIYWRLAALAELTSEPSWSPYCATLILERGFSPCAWGPYINGGRMNSGSTPCATSTKMYVVRRRGLSRESTPSLSSSRPN